MEEEVNRLVKKFLEGIDEDALRRGEVWSLDRFKANVGKLGLEIIHEPPEVKGRILRGLKAAGLQLIANIPIVTPIITAFLEVVTSEDLGDKIDKLGEKLGDKIDRLGDKIDKLGDKIDTLGDKIDTLGDKMDKMLSLQEKTITLQEKTIEILDERLQKKQFTATY